MLAVSGALVRYSTVQMLLVTIALRGAAVGVLAGSLNQGGSGW